MERIRFLCRCVFLTGIGVWGGALQVTGPGAALLRSDQFLCPLFSASTVGHWASDGKSTGFSAGGIFESESISLGIQSHIVVSPPKAEGLCAQGWSVKGQALPARSSKSLPVLHCYNRF
ncbi:MAG TPA: hypothetical protein VLM37_11380 [Fibrobacteraceae bacterium]|nr:hypothetical protein [Fibrobacteraceae bacterium]